METKKAWYQHNIAIILLLTFFFPIGIYLMWRSSDWHKWAKILVTSFFALFILSVINSPNSSNNSGADSTKQTAQPSSAPNTQEIQPSIEQEQSSNDFSLYAQSMVQIMPIIDNGNQSIIKTGEYGQDLEIELASFYVKQAQESYGEARSKLAEIQVPPEAQEIHDLITSALDEYLTAVTIYQEGIDTLDADRILEGVEHYNVGTNYLNRATEKITEKTEEYQ